MWIIHPSQLHSHDKSGRNKARDLLNVIVGAQSIINEFWKFHFDKENILEDPIVFKFIWKKKSLKSLNIFENSIISVWSSQGRVG